MFQSVLLILCLAISMGFFVYLIKHRSLGYKLLSIYCILCMILFLGEIYLTISSGIVNKLFGLSVAWIAYSLLPLVSVAFALYLINREDLIKSKYLILAGIVPLIGILGSFINCIHPIFYTIAIQSSWFLKVNVFNPIFGIILSYSLLLSILSIILVIWGLIYYKHNRRPLFIVLVAIFVPTICSLLVLYMREVVPLTFFFGLILLWWAVFGYDILDLSLVHQEFMDYANVGMLFFNEHNRLMEFNSFFKKYYPSSDIDFNQSVEYVFKYSPEVLDFLNSDDDEIIYLSEVTNCWFKVYKNNVYDNDAFIGRILIFEDITPEIEKQEQLELLIRESNHRMKNNLNLLNRFISLEKRFNKDNPEVIIEDTMGRIDSLSLYHEKLYRAENLKDINVSEYLNSFIDDVYSLYGGDQEDIYYDSNDNELILSGETIIPLSLILNELVINSLKYAFDGYDITNKKISISIDRIEDKIVLHYSDNGKGLPDDFNHRENTGLGWIVIQSLTNQLDGEYDVFNDEGMHFKLTFNI